MRASLGRRAQARVSSSSPRHGVAICRMYPRHPQAVFAERVPSLRSHDSTRPRPRPNGGCEPRARLVSWRRADAACGLVAPSASLRDRCHFYGDLTPLHCFTQIPATGSAHLSYSRSAVPFSPSRRTCPGVVSWLSCLRPMVVASPDSSFGGAPRPGYRHRTS